MAQEREKAARATSGGPYENWLLGQDSNLEPFG